MTMKTALVDVDGMIYAAGAVAETVYYRVDGLRFDYKTQANAHCDNTGLDRKDIEKEVDASPVSHALNALKTTLTAAVRDAGCEGYEGFLSPTGNRNFRLELYPEYKANRKDSHKPVHYQALRDYSTKYLGVAVANNMEADDILSIRAHELGFDKVVIVSNDKDMRTIPTSHFDWKNKDKGVVEVSQFDAWVNFYTQLLVGDTVDNIKGCPGVGPAKARIVLKNKTTDEEMLHACFAKYIEVYDGDEQEARKMMTLNAQLLHLLETRP